MSTLLCSFFLASRILLYALFLGEVPSSVYFSSIMHKVKEDPFEEDNADDFSTAAI